MSLRRLAARGVFWTALDNWGYQFATIATVAVLARLLSPGAFGLVALATIFTNLLRILADQGMADAIVQRMDLEDEHKDAAFWASVIFGVVLAGSLAATATMITSLFDDPGLAPVLAALSLTLAISGCMCRQTFARRSARRPMPISLSTLLGEWQRSGVLLWVNSWQPPPTQSQLFNNRRLTYGGRAVLRKITILTR